MVNNINVPAPWTPIKVQETEDGIVEVLGRKYDFGHEMFPHIFGKCLTKQKHPHAHSCLSGRKIQERSALILL